MLPRAVECVPRILSTLPAFLPHSLPTRSAHSHNIDTHPLINRRLSDQGLSKAARFEAARNMASRLLAAALSVLLGILLTWGTGMFPTPFARIQIDIVSYGAPLAYSTRVIPTHFLSYDWLNLALDFAFWTFILYLILGVILSTSPLKKAK
jgi:hypothetical protein